jgi:Domain of unknown function (DUF4440)
MTKILWIAPLAVVLALPPSPQAPETWREGCIQRCVSQSKFTDPELQRQEIISLEKEAAHAIQMSSGTFFRRVYSEDFAGSLSHGQAVDRRHLIEAIETPSVKYESFIATDIKVRLFENNAVATCIWSSRFISRGQHLSSQMRTIHVYVDTARGWQVVSGQATILPPDVQQPL